MTVMAGEVVSSRENKVGNMPTELLKIHLVLDYLHLSRHKKRCKKLAVPGNGKPLPNIPDAAKRTISLGSIPFLSRDGK